VEQVPWSETVEIDEQRWISLEFSRQWPKYAVRWQLRQRSGDGDFPAARGEIDQMPAGKDGADPIWESLRQRAIQAASQAAESTAAEAPKRSFFSRLRRSR
jgi:hypothetical protein